jgi:aarF domain-containing kinase
VRTFLILARYASRTVYEEQLESIRGSFFYPPNAFLFLKAWLGYARVEMKLSGYEMYLYGRRLIGLEPLVV